MLTHVPGYNVTTDSIRSKTVKDSYVKWDAGLLVNAVTTTNSSLTLDNSHDSFYINNANAATISVTILDTINDYTANGNNSLRRVNVIIDSRSAATDRTVTFTIPNTFTLIGGLSATRNLYHGNLQVFVVEIVNNTVNIYDGVGSYFEEDSNGDLMPLDSSAGLVPRTDLSGQLGTGDKRWAKVYAGNITNTYDSVADMVSDTSLKEGGTAFTKGYYVANDGGSALYTIRAKDVADVEDGGSIIFLDNGNMAELVTDGTVNVKQFGAIGNGTDDDTTVFQNTSTYAQSKGFVPFVGVATYKITSNVTGTFNSFGEVTITGGGTVDIINLQEVVSDVSDIRDEVVDETASAKAYSESAATSATNASNSASSAQATATALTDIYNEAISSGQIVAPAVDPTLTISGAAADAKITGDRINNIQNAVFVDSPNLYNKTADVVGLLNTSGVVIGTYTNYKTTDYIPVEYGDTICIQDSQKLSADTLYICEYDNDKGMVGSRSSLSIGLYVTSGNYAVVEANAKYVRISFIPQNWHADSMMISIGSSALPYQPYGLILSDSFVHNIKTPTYVAISNNVLRVITKYTNESDLCIRFEKHGGNNLPDFSDLATIPNTDFYPRGNYNDAVSFLSITTDWHSPFIVKAISNIDGDLPDSAHFTGGNHNYSNSGTSGYTATAVCDSLKYYVDGNEVSEYSGYCKNVKAVWVNRVQATNTKKADGTGRYVLTEKHTLEYDGGKWNSTVQVIPLENITIQTFYCFQAQVGTVYPNIRFIGATNRGLYTNATTNTSGDKIANAFEIYGTEHRLEVDLDTTYDIGDRRFYNGTSGIFNSTVKIYMYLIAGLSNANANNLYTARATYKFSHQ